MTQVELRQLRKSQRDDPIIGVWLKATTDKAFPSKKTMTSSNDHLTMSRHFDKFIVKRGLLYKEIVVKSERSQQPVVPSCNRKQILNSLHHQLRHPGRETAVTLVKKAGFIGLLTVDIQLMWQLGLRVVTAVCVGNIPQLQELQW